MASSLRAAAERADFTGSDEPSLLLDTELNIWAANPPYLQATGRHLDELMGRHMFDAFPDNPDDPDADGVASLSASLERVLRSGRSHNMIVQRYDVPTGPEASRRFLKRVWTPTNTPVRDERSRVVGAFHRVRDVSELVLGAQAAAPTLPRYRAGVQLRHLLDAMRQGRAQDQELHQHNDHLSTALSSVVAARHLNTPSPTGARRRYLWEQVSANSRPSAPLAWSQSLCDVAVRTVIASSASALSVRIAPRFRHFVAASDHWAEQLDEAEFILGEGPATSAVHTGAPVVTEDLRAEALRWPTYCQAADQAAVTGVVAFPLGGRDDTVGTLALYFREHRRVPLQQLIDASLLSELASTILITDLDGIVTRLGDCDKTGPDPLATAVGMTAFHLRVSTDEALARLRAHTFTTGLPLETVIEDIISHRRELD